MKLQPRAWRFRHDAALRVGQLVNAHGDGDGKTYVARVVDVSQPTPGVFNVVAIEVAGGNRKERLRWLATEGKKFSLKEKRR